MSKPREINVLHAWYKMNADGLLVKAFNAGYPYTSKGIIARSSLKKPIQRYAKNYTLKGEQYSLCIISDEKDTKKMEAWLDEQSKKIKAKDLDEPFKAVGVRYNA